MTYKNNIRVTDQNLGQIMENKFAGLNDKIGLWANAKLINDHLKDQKFNNQMLETALKAYQGIEAKKAADTQNTISNYQSGWNSAYNYGYGTPSSTGSTQQAIDYSELFREIASTNTAVNIAMNRENNQFNHDEAELQRSWESNMSNTAHQREVADLQAAGLNPVLSANAGASTPSGSSAGASNFAGADTSAVNALANVMSASMSANAAITSAAMHAQATQNAAFISADAAKYASNNSYNSAIYSADQALAGTRYSSDTTAEWQKQRTYVAGIVGAVQALSSIVGTLTPTKILKGTL